MTLKTAPAEEKIQGMIWGQFVGDAAALGSHWIYDLDELDREFPDGVQGFEPPRLNARYHTGKQPGEFTHYGDGALVMLESIADKGAFDKEHFGQSFFQLVTSQHYPGYRDKATTESAEAWKQAVESSQTFDYQQGADDNEPATATRLAPIVAVHGQEDNLHDVIAEAVRVVQDNEEAVIYNQLIAKQLSLLLEGSNFLEALNQVVHQARDSTSPVSRQAADKLEEAQNMKNTDVREATSHFGRSCPLPKCLPAAVQATLHFNGDFSSTIPAILNAGGDNAGRASIAGAFLGAEHGMDAIPEDWRSRLKKHTRIEAAIERIVSSRRAAEV